MAGTIDMQHMMYLNLFSKVTGVRTSDCFVYNQIIFFCIPKPLVSKAIGSGGKNTKKLNEILNKKIKVIAKPNGIEDVKTFIESIVEPIVFKDVNLKDNEVILSASTQSKAALIGRNKRRLLEMQQIIKDFFAKEFKIV
jgi:NusA-like KH domain protein